MTRIKPLVRCCYGSRKVASSLLWDSQYQFSCCNHVANACRCKALAQLHLGRLSSRVAWIGSSSGLRQRYEFRAATAPRMWWRQDGKGLIGSWGRRLSMVESCTVHLVEISRNRHRVLHLSFWIVLGLPWAQFSGFVIRFLRRVDRLQTPDWQTYSHFTIFLHYIKTFYNCFCSFWRSFPWVLPENQAVDSSLQQLDIGYLEPWKQRKWGIAGSLYWGWPKVWHGSRECWGWCWSLGLVYCFEKVGKAIRGPNHVSWLFMLFEHG